MSNRFPPEQRSGPGFGWAERFLGGSIEAEERFILSAIRDIHLVQERNRKRGGRMSHDRAFHAKIHAGIDNAEFVVTTALPSVLQGGFMQPGARYPAALRFSNASGLIQPDSAKDLRGLGVAVRTPFGEQHFLGTNGAVNHARDARQFIAFAKATSGPKALLLPSLIWNVGPLETVRMFRTVIAQTKRQVTSLTRETFWSRSPFAFGGAAARFQFTPRFSEFASVVPDVNYLRDDLVHRLLRGPVVYDLELQLFLNENLTPIEDGGVAWDSLLLPVAQLIIPQQDLTTAAALAMQSAVQEMEFNPWTTTEFVRPLGSLNRARRLVYKASVGLRKGRIPRV